MKKNIIEINKWRFKMKKIYFAICIILFLFTSCFAKSKKTEYSSDTHSATLETINENKRIITFILNKDIELNGNLIKKGTKIYHYKSDSFYKSNETFKIECGLNEDNEYLLDIANLSLCENNESLPDFLQNSYWIPNYYYDFIYSQDYSILFEHEKLWTEEWVNALDEAASPWYYHFLPTYLYFGKNYIFSDSNLIEYSDFYALCFLESIDEKIANIRILKTRIGVQNSSEDIASCVKKFRGLHTGYPYNLLIKYDGDYISLYMDNFEEENFIFNLVRANRETFNQIKNYVRRECYEAETYDLSEITWPRHADGSCDYDISSKNFSITNKQEQPAYCNGIQIDKIMTVQEHLEIRNLPAVIANSVVLKVMAPGTKVKITDVFFPEDTIDGITSIWVQVHVQDGGKDSEGKPIAAGWNGWVFGGYLK